MSFLFPFLYPYNRVSVVFPNSIANQQFILVLIVQGREEKPAIALEDVEIAYASGARCHIKKGILKPDQFEYPLFYL
jgi:hypothetical protein